VEYGKFEGTIPEGEYGAGPVIVWDRGRWRPHGDPHFGLEKGHLAFELLGEKLRGAWGLIRMRSRGSATDDRNWLLIKTRDDEARSGRPAEITALRPESVASGKRIEQVGAARSGSRGAAARLARRTAIRRGSQSAPSGRRRR
jgi:bifunctional non-homologous end joining protein LigD